MKRIAMTGLVGVVMALSSAVPAQDYSVLRINEVIASNGTQAPDDFGGKFVDMIEIYNSGKETIELGTAAVATSLALSDTLEIPIYNAELARYEQPWTFRKGVTILGESSIIVFCDGDLAQDFCEPHTSFKLASDGEEPVTLWGPVIGTDGDGNPVRQIIDQIWLPPLPEDVSFGRYPDGAGAAPVPIGGVPESWVFNPPGESTFGSCQLVPASGTFCAGGKNRFCRGASNGAGGNLHPRVELLEASTNSPDANEPVELRVRVEDDGVPTPLDVTVGSETGNISKVEVVYRVDGGPEEVEDFVYDAATGVLHATMYGDLRPDLSAPGGVSRPVLGEIPLKRWTEWVATIPGQPAGSRVEFYLRCEDAGEDLDPATAADNLSDTSPGTLCSSLDPPVEGPCDREFGGPGCQRDPLDSVVCSDDTPPDEEGDGGGGEDVTFTGVRYIECSTWFTYASGYEPPERLRGLVINEVVASQATILADPSEAGKVCDPTNPTCKFDDFIELYNGSGARIDLSGLWLSSSRFNPRGWQFPAGSKIDADEYLIVWLDNDGAKCPCPSSTAPDSLYCAKPVAERPCFWECPDPTNPSNQQYHTNFSIVADRDQIYLFDGAAAGYGKIHGTEFEGLLLDQSLSLIPRGDGTSCWVVTPNPTPEAANVGECPEDPEPKFVRGDANSDCQIDITDGVYVLNYLFTGGETPICLDAADTNDTGAVDISDGIFVLGFLFLGSEPPPYPGPSGPPGPDATPDELPACVEVTCG